jgi:serine/threonine-protein kinase
MKQGPSSSGTATTEAAGSGSKDASAPAPQTRDYGAPASGTVSAPATQHESDLAPGTRLGKYQIVRRLGQGGMGSVYEAQHTDIGKPVALKTLAGRLASDATAQARFLREAATASRLEHPHVVAVTDFGSDAGVTYLVMELLRGEDLGAAIAHEPRGLPVERVADAMLAVCAGVFAAHEAGVVHRDLKPQNVFLARTAFGEISPKVLDFGISKLLDAELASSLTNTGTVMGTTPYLSPEQLASGVVDGRSDQYALGVILYECVTGQRPHEGETAFAIMRAIAEGRFPPPRARRHDLPAAVEAIVMRAMDMVPDRRYESVHALGRALLPFASAKARVLWSDYYGAARAPAAVAAPAPGTTILPAGAAAPLPATRTSARTPTPPPATPAGAPAASMPTPVSEPLPFAPPRRRWVLPALALAAVAAAAAAWVLSRPRPVAPAVAPPAPAVPAPAAAPAAPPPAPVAPAAAAPSPRPAAKPEPPPAAEPRPAKASRPHRRAPKLEHGSGGTPILD